MSNAVLPIVQSLLGGSPLDESQAEHFFAAVVKGDVPDILLSSAITALKVRGQTVEELTGAALALIRSATPFPRPEYDFADIVGTGGDGLNTINLSTLAAITAAVCGAKIVKHGNRSISSVSGSFDLLEKLGIDFGVEPSVSRNQTDEFGLCFLFAPNYHAGLRHAANVRKSLKARTIFNLLGPLVNPARPPKMLLGVADPALLQPIADVLKRLGCKQAFVVHGSGVDEVAIHAPTTVVAVKGDEIETTELVPRDFGSDTFPLQDLICHDPIKSHQRSQQVIAGQGSVAEQSAVSVNVALLLSLFGEDDLKSNFARSMECLQAGQPMQLVERMVGSK